LSGSQLLKLWWVTSARDKKKKLGESFQQKYTQFVIFSHSGRQSEFVSLDDFIISFSFGHIYL